MPPSAAMLDSLGGNVTTMVPVWKITSTSGTVAAYASHTRNLVFGGVTYLSAQVEATRFTETLGVQQSNNVELFGIFDSIITEPDVQGGKWRNAKIQFEYIAYDIATGAASATITGSVKKIKGQAGKFTIQNQTYTVEVKSISDLLQQEIGDLTSPLDRNRSPEALGVSMGPFTFARTVTAAPDRRNLTVDGTAQVDNYFRYGRAVFTSGSNNGLSMEIKSNVGNVIELQLPMRSAIAASDSVTLIAGYDSTREQARGKFNAVINMNAEPDLPGIQAILSYPQ